MKVTHFGPNGFPWAHVSNFGGVTISIGSNTNTDPPLSSQNFVQRITANGVTTLLNPIVNFAGGSGITVSASSNTVTIAVSAGGTSPLTTKGDLYTFDTANQRLAVGSNGTGLYADSDQATGIRWTFMPIAGEILMQDGVSAPPIPLETDPTGDDWIYADL